MIGATIYLVLLIALVTKMVIDVQKSKKAKMEYEVHRMQVLAGLVPHDKKTKKKLSPHITGQAELR